MPLFALLLMTFFGFSSDHDIHLSKTTINYSHEKREIQIVTKLFIDDIERALLADGYTDLKLCTNQESPKSDLALAEYVKKHIFINDYTIEDYVFLGKEPSNDFTAVWIYYKIEDVSSPQALDVKADFLYELFDDQKSIVSITVDNVQKAHSIRSPHDESLKAILN